MGGLRRSPPLMLLICFLSSLGCPSEGGSPPDRAPGDDGDSGNDFLPLPAIPERYQLCPACSSNPADSSLMERLMDRVGGFRPPSTGEDEEVGEGGPPNGVLPDGIHSPVTEAILERLLAIASNNQDRRDEVFAKIGDSHSVGVTFLGCFAAPDSDLGEYEQLRPTLLHFSAEAAGGRTSFDRESVATVAGIGAHGVIKDEPSLLRREIDALNPRFALVMLGTNDVGYRPAGSFIEDMHTIVDILISDGVIPLLSTIPPLADRDEHDQVLVYNELIRALAEERGLLLVDLYAALMTLPEMGLRSDGVHLSVEWNRGGGMAACIMDERGFAFGANVRNLATLQQLDRARRAVLEKETFESKR